MNWFRLLISLAVFCSLGSELSVNVNAQTPARWLGQKTKEFSQGGTPADVLEELAKKHSFTVEFANDVVLSALETGKLYGNVDNLSIRQLVTAVSHLAAADGPHPWITEKSILKFVNPSAFVTVEHDVRLLGALMTDQDQFRQAVMNSVSGGWEVDQTNAYAAFGSILEVTPAAMKIRQTNRCHAELYELLDLLKQEVEPGASAKSRASEKRLLRTLGKQSVFKSMELSVLETFRNLLTENHVPWLLLIHSDSTVDPEAILQITEGKHRIIDVVDVAAMELELTVDLRDGVLVMTATDEEFRRDRPRVYNIQSLLGNSTPEDIADEITALDRVSMEWTEILGPLLIIQTDFASHRRIQAAIDGEPAVREPDAQIVQIKPVTNKAARIGDGGPPEAPENAKRGRGLKLILPKAGALLPNGDFTKRKEFDWVFDWADVPNATRYHLVVKGATAQIAIIDRNDILKSNWKDTRTGVVTNPFLRNWGWKVRAFVNGEWTEWSDTRKFDVEAAR